MGNRRFRLSDMMPNAWFYKLRDMSSQAKRRSSDRSCHMYTRKQSSPTSILPSHGESQLAYHPRHDSFYSNERSPMKLEEHLSYVSPSSNTKALDICPPPNLVKRSPKRPLTNRKTTSKPCHSPRFTKAADQYTWHSDQDATSDPFDELGFWSSISSPRVSSSTADIIFDIDNKSSVLVINKLKKFDRHMALPPILTKAASKYEQETNRRRRRRRTKANVQSSLLVGNEPGSGVKVRARVSPRVLTIRRMRRTRRSASSTSTSRSSLSESYAVIKCSYDPEKDFRDSMMEMIMEHRIQASGDLEDLLACYLTLNSYEYHNHIVEAFKRIWCDVFCGPVYTAAGETETMFDS